MLFIVAWKAFILSWNLLHAMWIRGNRVYTTFEFAFDVFDLSACMSVPFHRSLFQNSFCSSFSILHLFGFGVVSFPAHPNTLPYQLFIVGWNIILRNAFLVRLSYSFSIAIPFLLFLLLFLIVFLFVSFVPCRHKTHSHKFIYCRRIEF